MDAKTIKKWRDELSGLLGEARAVAQTASLTDRLAVADRLQAFIIENPSTLADEPETKEFEEMDAIARKAHDGLLLDAITERLAVIMSQSAELAGLTKKIQGQTVANEKAARALRFEKARNVISAATVTVGAIQQLQEQLEAQTEDDQALVALGAKLRKALQTLQDLRAAVEQAG